MSAGVQSDRIGPDQMRSHKVRSQAMNGPVATNGPDKLIARFGSSLASEPTQYWSDTAGLIQHNDIASVGVSPEASLARELSEQATTTTPSSPPPRKSSVALRGPILSSLLELVL